MTGVDIGGKHQRLDLTLVHGSTELKDNDQVITKNPYTGLLYCGYVSFDTKGQAWVTEVSDYRAPYRRILTKALFAIGVYKVEYTKKSSI